MAKLEALARQRRAVLRLSIHESASEVNRSGGDAQVVSYHRYLVVFHPFVEQLITVFDTSGLASSASVYYTERKLKNKKRERPGNEATSGLVRALFRVLDLDLHAIARWHPERHVPKDTHKPLTQSLTRYGHTYIHTYIQPLGQRSISFRYRKCT